MTIKFKKELKLNFGDQVLTNIGSRLKIIKDKGDYIEAQVMAPKRSPTLIRITHDEITRKLRKKKSVKSKTKSRK